MEPFHLDRYVGEHVFRFNDRAINDRAIKDNPLDDANRFTLAVLQISGKRLTYAEPTRKVEPGSPSLFDLRDFQNVLHRLRERGKFW